MDALTKDDLKKIIWGGHPNYKDIVKKSVCDRNRWCLYYEKVVQHKSGRYYSLNWVVGATEYQECDLDPEITEVFPKEVTTTIYTTKKD